MNITNKPKLELTWIGKNNPDYDIANIEPRILEENPELSNTANDPDTDNMIIHGDNLLALKALLPEYEGKIKCVYIDPPYNTGNAFEHYDDSVEHSTWLSLMKPRLELLKILLKDDGLIFVQIDDNEQAYL
ncbi:MAG: DNA methyltransferase, partial [bacterium]